MHPQSDSAVCKALSPFSTNPTHQINLRPNADVPESEAMQTWDQLTQSGGSKPKALIVDDVEDVTEMLSVFLHHAGFDVTTAGSAPAAIAAAQAKQFDVIVSDIGMPEMNGYQLAEALRKLPGYSSIPMIAVTGFSMYDDKQRSLRSGFDAHLTKPIDPVNLFELIEQLRG